MCVSLCMVWVCEYVRSSADVCERVYVYLCAYLCDTEPQITSCPRPSETNDICLVYSHRLYSCYHDVHLNWHSAVIHLHDSHFYVISKRKRFLNIIFWLQVVYIALQSFKTNVIYTYSCSIIVIYILVYFDLITSGFLFVAFDTCTFCKAICIKFCKYFLILYN